MNWMFFFKAAIVGVIIVGVSELVVVISEYMVKRSTGLAVTPSPAMDWQFVLKTAITVGIIVGVSEVVKHSNTMGALIVALPFTSILVMTWMYVEGAPVTKIAQHSSSTFWYVLPTMPMFLVLPKLLEAKWHYYLSLFLCCALTTALFLLMDWMQNRYAQP
jgi:hypothetical protein